MTSNYSRSINAGIPSGSFKPLQLGYAATLVLVSILTISSTRLYGDESAISGNWYEEASSELLITISPSALGGWTARIPVEAGVSVGGLRYTITLKDFQAVGQNVSFTIDQFIAQPSVAYTDCGYVLALSADGKNLIGTRRCRSNMGNTDVTKQIALERR